MYNKDNKTIKTIRLKIMIIKYRLIIISAE